MRHRQTNRMTPRMKSVEEALFLELSKEMRRAFVGIPHWEKNKMGNEKSNAPHGKTKRSRLLATLSGFWCFFLSIPLWTLDLPQRSRLPPWCQTHAVSYPYPPFTNNKTQTHPAS